jgi:hypothetical protein
MAAGSFLRFWERREGRFSEPNRFDYIIVASGLDYDARMSLGHELIPYQSSA